MYHVELRQFPHNLNRFNLDEPGLQAILDPWAREKVVELGERKWSPHQATITILEGPHLDVARLAMGRGWRAAQRVSEDVTERRLAEATAALAGAVGVPSPSADAVAGESPTDPLALGVQLAALLGPDPTALLAAWREVASSAPGLSPSESLALAERQLSAARPGPAADPGR